MKRVIEALDSYFTKTTSIPLSDPYMVDLFEAWRNEKFEGEKRNYMTVFTSTGAKVEKCEEGKGITLTQACDMAAEYHDMQAKLFREQTHFSLTTL